MKSDNIIYYGFYKDSSQLSVKCPFKPVKVGSAFCQDCVYFEKMHKEVQIVKCKLQANRRYK